MLRLRSKVTVMVKLNMVKKALMRIFNVMSPKVMFDGLRSRLI